METGRNNHRRASLGGQLHRRFALPVLLLLATAPGIGAQVLEIEPRAIVSGARVLLQDLVRAGTSLPEGWGARIVADAPSLLETKALSLTEVAQMMSGYDDMRHVVLRGKPVIQVSVQHRTLDMERVQQAVDRYVQSHAEWAGRRFEVAPDPLNLPRVPNGKLDVEVVALHEGSGSEPLAADLRVVVDGQPYEAGPLSVNLIEQRAYWAATRPLARGEVLTADAIEKRWIAEPDASRYYPAEHPVAGMELRRAVQSGQLLAAGMLAQPVYARRGEMVRVVSRRGGLTVSLRARALVDGRREERILCVNEQSGRRMQVRLVQPRGAVLDNEPGDSQS